MFETNHWTNPKEWKRILNDPKYWVRAEELKPDALRELVMAKEVKQGDQDENNS